MGCELRRAREIDGPRYIVLVISGLEEETMGGDQGEDVRECASVRSSTTAQPNSKNR